MVRLRYLSILILMGAGLMAATPALDERTYYTLLGVPQDAPVEVIKKAYRQLSKVYHPDKNPGDQTAEERFKKIVNAYEVLSSPVRRGAYDFDLTRSQTKSSSQSATYTKGGGTYASGGPTYSPPPRPEFSLSLVDAIRANSASYVNANGKLQAHYMFFHDRLKHAYFKRRWHRTLLTYKDPLTSFFYQVGSAAFVGGGFAFDNYLVAAAGLYFMIGSPLKNEKAARAANAEMSSAPTEFVRMLNSTPDRYAFSLVYFDVIVDAMNRIRGAKGFQFYDASDTELHYWLERVTSVNPILRKAWFTRALQHQGALQNRNWKLTLLSSRADWRTELLEVHALMRSKPELVTAIGGSNLKVAENFEAAWTLIKDPNDVYERWAVVEKTIRSRCNWALTAFGGSGP